MNSKILLVEDKKKNREAYLGVLKDEFPSAQLLAAANDEEALRYIESEPDIDVVITDLSIDKDDSGMRILHATKQKDQLIMVIIITAYDDKLDRKEAFKLGAFDCLDKASPGVKTSNELVYKTRSAIHSRHIALKLLQSQRNIDFMRKYFDPLVFDMINKNPTILEPKNRIVTVVFWDIRGFSALSETLKAYPNLIATFLREYLEIASRVIFANNGVLDKFIGDGVMALFGSFDDYGNREQESQAATNAIKSAVDFRSEFVKLYSKWKIDWQYHSAENIDIGLGCGIHTGEALVGNLGTEKRDHFTAVGPHVNLAARIESSSKSGEIRFSATTKSRVDGNFHIKKIETLKDIKNIRGNYDIFEITD